MDLTGAQERYKTFQDEQSRATPVIFRGPEEIASRREQVMTAFSSICRIAEWHGGKGARSLTDPIVLEKLEHGDLVVRVASFDAEGNPIDNSRAKEFEVRLAFRHADHGGTEGLGSEYFYGSSGLMSAERTVAMLLEAIQDPELNPQFQQYLHPQS